MSLRVPFDGCGYFSADPYFRAKKNEAFIADVPFGVSATLRRPFTNELVEVEEDHLDTLQFTKNGQTLTRVIETREASPDGSVVSRRHFETSTENQSQSQEVLLQGPLLAPNSLAYSFNIEGQTRVALVAPEGFSVHDAEGIQYGEDQGFTIETQQAIVRDDQSASLAMRARWSDVDYDADVAGLIDSDSIDFDPIVVVQSFGCFSPPAYTQCTSQMDCANDEYCELVCPDGDDVDVDEGGGECQGVCVPNDLDFP